MRKRGVYLVVVVLVVLGALTWAFTRNREPEYGGKRLSEWVESYSADFSGGKRLGGWVKSYSADFSEPYAVTDSSGALDGVYLEHLFALLTHVQEALDETNEGIRHIGSNALPCLMKWIRYERPSWKTKLYAAINFGMVKLKLRWQFTDKNEVLATGALSALKALGPAGEAAIPDLARIVCDPKAGRRSAERAVDALASFGPHGLPAILAGLKMKQRDGIREYFVFRIGQMGTNAGPAIPVLQTMLSDQDVFTRGTVASALQQIDPRPLERAKP